VSCDVYVTRVITSILHMCGVSMPYQQLATEGILISGCSCVMFVNFMSYRPFVGILPHVQLWCIWGQRWTDYIL